MSHDKPNHLAARSIVLGTAGHIDHGKTSLVFALTGADADRLPEEKARDSFESRAVKSGGWINGRIGVHRHRRHREKRGVRRVAWLH